MSLPEAQFVLPEYWDKDWTPAENAEEWERRLLNAQGRSCAALKELQSLPFSPEAAAWLHLWSRHFNICETVWGAMERDNASWLRCVDRMAFELGLHVFCIADPILRPNHLTRGLTVGDRLRAYLSWCLVNDLRQADEVLKSLESIYDPKPGRDLARNLEGVSDWWEDYFGDLEVVSDQEAEFDRKRHEAQLLRRRDQLEEWLDDSRLKEWPSRIKGLRHPTLFQVFEDSEASVRAHLQKRGSSVLYSLFAKSSGALHGSGLDAYLRARDDLFMPVIGDVLSENTDKGKQISVFLGLVGSTMETFLSHVRASPA